MTRTTPSAIAILLLTAILAGACGDSEPLTVEAYFAKVDELQERIDQRFAEQEQNDTQTLTSSSNPEEIAVILRSDGESTAEVFRAAADDFDSVSPPAELASQHEQLVESSDALADAFDAYAAQLPGSITLTELSADDSFFSSPDIDAGFAALSEACRQLADAAADRGIELGLTC